MELQTLFKELKNKLLKKKPTKVTFISSPISSPEKIRDAFHKYYSQPIIFLRRNERIFELNNDITESEFGAVLHHKWIADEKEPNIIIGYWAEDNSPFTLDVPQQLRPIIIRLQNWLHDKYMEMYNIKHKATKLSTFFNGLMSKEDHDPDLD